MKLTSAAFLVAIFTSRMGSAYGETCRSTGQVFPMGLVNQELSEFMVDLNKNNSIDAAERDFKGFCEWNRMDRASGELQSRDPSAFAKYLTRKREGNRQEAGNSLGEVSTSGPWKSSMRGNRNAKLKDGSKLRRGGSHFYATYAEVNGEKSESVFLAEFAKKMVSNLKSDFEHAYLLPEIGKVNIKQLNLTQRLGLCSGITGPFGMRGCASALGMLMPKLEVSQENASTLDPKLINQTLGDVTLTKALKKVSTSIWERIQNNQFKKSDNIFLELENAFREEGVSKIESRNKALQIMGTLSVGGPNFATRGLREETSKFPACTPSCNPNNVYLSAIAEGLVHADTLKMDSANPSLYSLPDSVDFPCDSGKNYHFWMSAYCANQLKLEGASKSSAQSAVFVSHLGYQISRDEHLGGGGSNLLKMGRFTSPENGTRIDIILAAAGAKFGVEESSSKTINARKAYSEVLRAGSLDSTQEDWSQISDPRKYYKWLDRIGAQKALEEFMD